MSSAEVINTSNHERSFSWILGRFHRPRSPVIVDDSRRRWWKLSKTKNTRRTKASPQSLPEQWKDPRYAKSLALHRVMVERINETKAQTIDPFAASCQQAFEMHGGFPFDLQETSQRKLEVELVRQFVLPKSRGPTPVCVLDHVISPEWCRLLIRQNEQIGFGRPPSLQDIRRQTVPREYQDYDTDRSKNTSELVQLESQELADYLWKRVNMYLPDRQRSIPSEGVIKPLTSLGGPDAIYEKRGIIPVFRFMRYQAGQGFKAHVDPERSYAIYPIKSKLQSQARSFGDEGIFRSIFTIAIYLNDSSDFQGGNLSFVEEVDRFKGLAPGIDQTGSSELFEATKFRELDFVVPSVGRCALFRHDELHEGGGVDHGTKYMVQCDVLYECIGLGTTT